MCNTQWKEGGGGIADTQTLAERQRAGDVEKGNIERRETHAQAFFCRVANINSSRQNQEEIFGGMCTYACKLGYKYTHLYCTKLVLSFLASV